VLLNLTSKSLWALFRKGKNDGGWREAKKRKERRKKNRKEERRKEGKKTIVFLFYFLTKF
jgi:hypothetical protein